ncbi:MAG TPA: efflux RND transporter periplasmic adaptor subunit [Candidatus Wujingus californicus]|uniref:efflux RND transporter periplasmic adaptor subunit n=2 Tax=Candidatus Wujingus californicus TaxID=3367618 RepID=UPI001D205A03|nr:efflux RND transporter periplasmic adaptor subunit [Planctomycetota bacterium]MDO8131552.1 efflux RND transporter periplasmic adaptor subunit [Candidatus Brocadiales bacterium]
MIRKYLPPVLAVFGIGFAIWTVIAGNKELPSLPPVVEPGAPPYRSFVAGSGIVETNTENISIGTCISGVVSEVYVSVGTKIKTGDSLFKLDDRDLKAQLEVRQSALREAEAEVKVSRATLADLKDQLARAKILAGKRVISDDELERRRYAVEVAEAKLIKARTEVVSAKAYVNETKVNLERAIVRAPVDGDVLQVKIHTGEYALAGVTETSLMLIGNAEPLNVRVDVDENDAWRLRAGAPAVAFLRGNREIQTPLKFVRFEPFIVPKKSLTGDSVERVDTRVLQVIYSIERKDLQVFAGQQMDVYIDSAD